MCAVANAVQIAIQTEKKLTKPASQPCCSPSLAFTTPTTSIQVPCTLSLVSSLAKHARGRASYKIQVRATLQQPGVPLPVMCVSAGGFQLVLQSCVKPCTFSCWWKVQIQATTKTRTGFGCVGCSIQSTFVSKVRVSTPSVDETRLVHDLRLCGVCSCFCSPLGRSPLGLHLMVPSPASVDV